MESQTQTQTQTQTRTETEIQTTDQENDGDVDADAEAPSPTKLQHKRSLYDTAQDLYHNRATQRILVVSTVLMALFDHFTDLSVTVNFYVTEEYGWAATLSFFIMFHNVFATLYHWYHHNQEKEKRKQEAAELRKKQKKRDQQMQQQQQTPVGVVEGAVVAYDTQSKVISFYFPITSPTAMQYICNIISHSHSHTAIVSTTATPTAATSPTAKIHSQSELQIRTVLSQSQSQPQQQQGTIDTMDASTAISTPDSPVFSSGDWSELVAKLDYDESNRADCWEYPFFLLGLGTVIVSYKCFKKGSTNQAYMTHHDK